MNDRFGNVWIVASLLIAAGCGPVRWVHVETPDVLNPVCMSPAPGTDSENRGTVAADFEATVSSAQHAMAGAGSTIWTNVDQGLQGQIMEYVKGSPRRALSNLEILVETNSVNGIVYFSDSVSARVRGTLVDVE